MQSALIRLQKKGQLAIPRSLRQEAGIGEGTLMKIAVLKGGRILVTPQIAPAGPVIAFPRKNRKQVLIELAGTVADLRREAKEKGLDTMSKSEINAAVATARKLLRTENTRPAQ